MMRAARARLEIRASSGCLSVGQETIRKVSDPRKASRKSRDAGELSKSCTTMGRSLTVSEIAVLRSSSRTRGSTSARARVRQSRVIWISSFRVCAKTRRILFLLPVFAQAVLTLLPRFLDNADKYVFQRKAPLARADDANAMLRKLSLGGFESARVVRDNVQPVAEQGNAPTLDVAAQQISRALRLVDNQLPQITFLAAPDAAGSALRYQLTGNHHAQPVALLSLLQIVRSHQNGRAGIGQSVDHGPEAAAGQWIHTRCGLVEKQDSGLVHGRGAECYALLPAAGEAARDLLLLALQAGELEHPAYLFLVLTLRDAVNAGKKFQILPDGEIVIQREFL